jgi:hypothetical protein
MISHNSLRLENPPPAFCADLVRISIVIKYSIKTTQPPKSRRLQMTSEVESRTVSRRRMVSLLGLAAALGLAASSTEAEAQTSSTTGTPSATGTTSTTGTPGMQRRQERRGGRVERRYERRGGTPAEKQPAATPTAQTPPAQK